MVVDTSAILAVFFAEKHADWARDRMLESALELRMSTVNLTETLIRIEDRQPTLSAALRDRLLGSGIRFIPPDVRQAELAAAARLRFPLNLGDCFAYALAVVERCPILSVDRDFRELDVAVVSPETA